VKIKSLQWRQRNTYYLKFTKLLAPFTPFFAEDMYRRIDGQLESVHLENWPVVTKGNQDVLEDMKITRDVISEALELRARSNIKVRQPLMSLTITKTR